MTPINKENLLRSFLALPSDDGGASFLKCMKATSLDEEVKQICEDLLVEILPVFDDCKEYKGGLFV